MPSPGRTTSAASPPKTLLRNKSMANPTGFLEIERRDRAYENAAVRRRNWREFVKPLSYPQVIEQSARCMDCGIPFCHTGCPVNNLIPDWNNLVYRDQWRAALEMLHSTNNFPESLDAFAQRHVRPPARSTSTTIPSPSRPLSARSSTAAGKRLDRSANSRAQIRQVRGCRWVGAGGSGVRAAIGARRS